ncbi:MAG: PepSY domain-containing protein [Planctomycetes bacterium]|nr:PepSY domain-containing protein [Planctomycetota bacterium]
MKPYKFCWELHKWLGIVLCLILINISVTGLLLLEKKRCDWIQPPTQKGREGKPEDFVTIQTAVDAVLDCNHADFATANAIDRIDVRPGKRVYKVISKTNHTEIQVDAITGQVLSQATRSSDMLEQLHDGSLFGEWVHALRMPLVAVANIVVAVTGMYLWLGPKFRKKKAFFLLHLCPFKKSK